MTHIKTPLIIGFNGTSVYQEGCHFPLAECISKEAAQRIVACVNACAGAEISWLESMAKVGGFGVMNQYVTAYSQLAEAISLEKQRDELLAQRDRLQSEIDAIRRSFAFAATCNHVARMEFAEKQRDELLTAAKKAIDLLSDCGPNKKVISAYLTLQDAILSVDTK